ncbi:MAG: hypothetical protein J0I21_04945 [Alphaproteobacteria bacterium]|nr:hypothetical protein [Alphaproteobacteria bacterium]
MTTTTAQTFRRIALQALVVLALGTALIGTAAAATPDAPAQVPVQAAVQAPGQAQDAATPLHAFIGEGWG